jgi:hypothetical protein
MIQLEEAKMSSRLFFMLCTVVVTLMLSFGVSVKYEIPSVNAHAVCSLGSPNAAIEVPCDYSVPPKPGTPASSRKWYTGEHTPGYHERVWYDYNPPCTKNRVCPPIVTGFCWDLDVPTPRVFPGPNDIAGPSSGKKRLYCGSGTTSPVPHLHYIEPIGS